MNKFDVSVMRVPHNLGLSIYCNNVSYLVLLYLHKICQSFVGVCLTSAVEHEVKARCEFVLSDLWHSGTIRENEYMIYEFAIFLHEITPKEYYCYFASKT